MQALPLHLIEAVLIAYHPIVAQRSLPLQPENAVQFPHPRAGQVKVLRGCRPYRETRVVLLTVFLLQVAIGLF